METLCTLLAATDVNVDGNTAKVIVDSEYYDKDQVSLEFVDGEWLIDDLGNCSRQWLKNMIKESRNYYKNIDWLELIHVLEERGYSKEDAVAASDGLREEIETYFENYPE